MVSLKGYSLKRWWRLRIVGPLLLQEQRLCVCEMKYRKIRDEKSCQDYKWKVVVTLPHPLKITQVVVAMGVIGMGAPIFALVPIVHFLLPGNMVTVLIVAGAPVDWSSSSPGSTSLPGGVGNGLSLFGRLDWLDWSLLHLYGRAAATVTKRGPLVGNRRLWGRVARGG